MPKVEVYQCASCSKLFKTKIDGTCHVYLNNISSYVHVQTRPRGEEDRDGIYSRDVCKQCSIKIIETAASILKKCKDDEFPKIIEVDK
jgi:DNA-directed RNA polymerase subunit RPC12/RpoP